MVWRKRVQKVTEKKYSEEGKDGAACLRKEGKKRSWGRGGLQALGGTKKGNEVFGE